MDGVKLLEIVKDTKNEFTKIENNFPDIKNELDNRQKAIINKSKETTQDPDIEVSSLQNQETYILSISGMEFYTSIATLSKNKSSLFYKIISGKINKSNKLYFDRPPFLFSHILDFMRFQTITLEQFTIDELFSLKEEADYYNLHELTKVITDKEQSDNVIYFTHFDISGAYMFRNQEVGDFNLECLSVPDLSTGICTNSPGFIIIELDKAYDINTIRIGGYTGDRLKFDCENGQGANISTSDDRVNWTIVGTIPYGFGSQIKKVILKKTVGNYIKFSCSNSIGIGYLNIN